MKLKAIEDKLKSFAKGKAQEVADADNTNCVIYTRVSSKEQADTNQSLGWQKKYCDEYALKYNMNIIGYFGGTYESAKSDERKEFNRMLKFVKASKKKVSYILVYSLDRFSRTGDSAIYISSELKKIGINILAVTQPIDTSSHTGSLQQNIQFIFSKYENDLRRQKTIDGMREKLLRGEWLGQCPIGYEYLRTLNDKPEIIINSDGALIKQAFAWKLEGMQNVDIQKRLVALGLKLSFQRLTVAFQNPFYCGYLANTLLNGEIVKGNHPPLISEEDFIKVQKLKDRGGYKQDPKNTNLPLKSFVKDNATGVPFTGYLVKKKGLYYYKANKAGVKINRSNKIMHELFIDYLKYYTFSEEMIEALKLQLIYTWENLAENSSNDKRTYSVKLNELEKQIEQLERRHALGEVSLDIFKKYSAELYGKRDTISQELENLGLKLSNPKELIEFSIRLSSKLPTIWQLSDYTQKLALQNLVFPDGIRYDAQIEHYRTTKINTVFGCLALFAKGADINEKSELPFLKENSPLVAPKIQISDDLLENIRVFAKIYDTYLYDSNSN